MENRRVRRVRAPPPMDPWRGRSRRREGGLAAVSASRARAAASAVRSEVNSCYPIVRKPAKALVGLGRHALSSHRASEAAAAAPRREKRTRRASRSGAAASPVAGGDATRAPHVPHASRVGIRGDATIAGRSRRTRGAPRGGARANFVRPRAFANQLFFAHCQKTRARRKRDAERERLSRNGADK